MTSFGTIGTGRLGTALLRAAGTHAPEVRLLAASRDPSKTEKLQREIPGLVATSPEELAQAADLIVLCVPPDAYFSLCDRIAPHLGSGAIVISVANSVPLAAIAERVCRPVVKAIPTPMFDAMMAETAGAVAALASAGYDWRDIVHATATPGGMTEAALDVLTSRFPQIAEDMVAATFARQAEIQIGKQASP